MRNRLGTAWWPVLFVGIVTGIVGCSSEAPIERAAESAGSASGEIRLSYLRAEHSLAVVVRPSALLQGGQWGKLASEQELSQMVGELPVPLRDIALLQVFSGVQFVAAPPSVEKAASDEPMPQAGEEQAEVAGGSLETQSMIALLEFTHAINPDELAQKFEHEAGHRKELIDGRPLYHAAEGFVYFPSDQIMILSRGTDIDAIVKPVGAKSELATRLEALGDDQRQAELLAVVSFQALQPEIDKALEAGALLGMSAAALPVLRRLNAATLCLHAEGNELLHVQLDAYDEQKAQEVEGTLQLLINQAKQAVSVQGQQSTGETSSKLLATADEALEGLSLIRAGNRLDLTILRPKSLEQAIEAQFQSLDIKR